MDADDLDGILKEMDVKVSKEQRGYLLEKLRSVKTTDPDYVSYLLSKAGSKKPREAPGPGPKPEIFDYWQALRYMGNDTGAPASMVLANCEPLENKGETYFYSRKELDRVKRSFMQRKICDPTSRYLND